MEYQEDSHENLAVTVYMKTCVLKIMRVSNCLQVKTGIYCQQIFKFLST